MPVRNSTLLALLLLLLLCVAGTSQAATLQSATAAYEKRDFATAYREFLALARLGSGLAQFNVGVMLLNGEGVPRSVREGYAWLLCAEDHGVVDATPLVEQIAAQVKPETTAKARECIASTGREAAKALAPPLPHGEDWGANGAPRAIGRIVNVFPDSARGQSLIGWVDTEITLGPDGRVRDLWIVESFPEGYFDDATLDGLRALKYEPARLDGRPVPVVMSLRYRYGYEGDWSARDLDGLEAMVQRLEKEGAQGKVASQYVLYRFGEVFPELRKRIAGWEDWGRKAAGSGFAPAAFYTGYAAVMSRGNSIETDRQRGLESLRKVAVAGGSTALVALGRLALAEQSEAGYARARRWLEAAGDDRWAARYLAVALLSPADPAQRDGARALALAEPLLQDPLMRDDPSTWQIAAAAYAEVGRGADAVRAQERAIERARHYDWALEELVARRKDYGEGRRAATPPLSLVPRLARFKADSTRARVCEETGRTGSRVATCEDPRPESRSGSAPGPAPGPAHGLD